MRTIKTDELILQMIAYLPDLCLDMEMGLKEYNKLTRAINFTLNENKEQIKQIFALDDLLQNESSEDLRTINSALNILRYTGYIKNSNNDAVTFDKYKIIKQRGEIQYSIGNQYNTGEQNLIKYLGKTLAQNLS